MTKDTYCTLPFIHSHASVNGTFKPCCNAEGRDQPSTTNKYTLASWFEGTEMQQLRQALLDGVRNPMCGRCWRDEARAGSSIRFRMNEKYAHLADTNKPAIKYLDLKLSNECNLQCRMCDQTQSHLINKDIELIKAGGDTIPTNWQGSTIPGYMNKIKPEQYSALLKLIPHIKVLKVTGGEPTIQPEVLELFDECIKQGVAKDIKLNITTNGTKFTKRFLDKISVFQEVRFNISVDGYGPTYEYIRYPFKWDKFTQRQNELNGYKDVFKWSYTCVPQMYNIENLHKLQQYCESMNSTLYLNNILHPDGIFNSLDIVPNHILQYAIDNIKLNDDSKILINYLNQMVTQDKRETESRLANMYAMVISVDKVRKQCYNQYLEPLTVAFIEQAGLQAR